jgi:ABC-2 type transport system permease protein
MKTWQTLVRREFWENRTLWMAPAAAALFLIIGSIGIAVRADGFNFNRGRGMGSTSGLAQGLEVSVYVFASMILGIGALAVFLYCLDSLYGERKDRSILFWKSLPVSDAQTVLSKALVACAVMPVALYLLVVVTHLLSGVILSLSPAVGATMRMWEGGLLPRTYGHLALVMFVNLLWYLPVVAYALLASVLAPRSPLIFAALPVIILSATERIVIGSSGIWSWVWQRLSPPRESQPLLTLDLWAGVAVAVVIVLLVIRLRRWREES